MYYTCDSTMLNTELAKLLNIEFPILQGGMAHISTGKMAGSISEAGGLGIISSASRNEDYLKQQIDDARRITKKAFGVNVMLANPRTPELMELIIREKIPIVATGAGTPEPYMDRLLAAGCKVIPVVPHVRAAKKMEAIGAFAVVAEGRESGGHVGPTSTMVLLPQVVDAVKIPVIAAGGIADGRGYCAAIILGAIGVQLGTAFLLAKECPISDLYKKKIIEADDRSTIVTGIGTRDEVRCIINPLTDKYFDLIKQPGTENEQMDLLVGSLYKAVQGDMEKGSIQVGQIAGMLKVEKTARQIMEDLMMDAYRVYEKFTM